MPLYALIILVSLTLFYTFYIGFNNGANTVATTIATRAMKPHIAIAVAGVTKFITPIVLYFVLRDHLTIADTIKGVLQDGAIESAGVNKTVPFLIAGLIATQVWNFFTYYQKMPNSTSHTLMGGIVGSAIACFGVSYIHWNTVIFKILLMAILAPILGLAIGFGFMTLFRRLARSAPYTINNILINLQRLNVVILASSFSMNDVQKSLGIFLIIMSIGNITSFTGTEYDLLILLTVSGLMLAAGMFFGGYRIINTVGNKIFKLKPHHSAVAQASTAAIIYLSSIIGIPVSTGQVVSSSVMGVGAAERLSGVQWYTAKKIFISWLITFPAAAVLGAIMYNILRLIF